MVARPVFLKGMIVLLSTSSAWADTASLVVEEPSGIRRDAWPVTSGIPLPRGALKNPGHARLLEGDTELPLQTEVLCKWPDGSVKWLLVDFLVDLDAGERKTFSLQYGPDLRPAPVDNPVRVADETHAIVVDTGPMRFRLSRERFRLLDAVWLDLDGDGKLSDDERVTGPDGAGIVLTTPDGKTFQADAASMTIEQAGPVRACVRVQGKHASPDGAMLRYIVRIHAFRGRPFVRLHYTFINDHQDELMARIDSLDLVFSLAGKGNLSYVLDGKSSRAGRLFQVDDQRCEVNGEPVGKCAPGWAALGGDQAGLAVGVREFWQNWPKSIAVDPGTLAVGICPQFPKGLYDGKPLEEENKLYYFLRDGVYTFKVGVARTHELWATFYPGRPDVAGLTRFFRAAEDPLLATCEPAHLCAAKALGEFPPADPNKYAGYDAWLDQALNAHLDHRRRIREYGMLNYGDWYGERQVNWGNLEYDLAYGLFLQYARTGDRRFFLRAEQAARHHIDVDVVHATNPHLENPWGPPPAVGEIWVHCLNHTGGYYQDAPLPVSRTYQMGYSQNFGHVWVGGDFAYYYFTGDRRARNVAIQIADAMVRHCPTRYGDHIRALGWPIVLVLAAYDATGDPKYLDAATQCWQVLQENIDWQRGWVVQLAKGHCLHPDRRCYGNVPFMEGLTVCALARYHRITGEPRVLQAISVGIDQMIRECWQEDVKGFSYTACPLTKKTTQPGGYVSLSAEALAYEAALTGNKEHLRILREGLQAAIQTKPGPEVGKSLAMTIHFTPFGLSAVEQ